LALYFASFFKLINSLDIHDRDRFRQAGSPASFIISLLLIPPFFFVHILWFRLLVASIMAVYLVWSTWKHQQKLQALGFEPQFIQRLTRVTLLSAVGLLLIFGSMLL
jgi:hypothetical protein